MRNSQLLNISIDGHNYHVNNFCYIWLRIMDSLYKFSRIAHSAVMVMSVLLMVAAVLLMRYA